MLIFYIQKPTELMRKAPDNLTQVVSEALYSEEIDLLEERDDWRHIRTKVDKYEGWVRKEAIAHYGQEFFDGTVAKICRSKVHIYHIPDTKFGPILSLPFESRLKILEELDVRWVRIALLDGREGYVQRGDIQFERKVLSKEEMVALSKQFLGLPYTWGGRSSFGFDCSGFVQMLYRQMGIYLPRDAKEQIAWEGFSSREIEEIEAGDLIFFGKDANHISHVGMALGDPQFIHATVQESQPWIRISDLQQAPWDGSGDLAFRAARRASASPQLRAPKFMLPRETPSALPESGE